MNVVAPMLVVLATIDVHPDDVPATTALALAPAAETRKEPGCLHYAFAADIVQPGRFRLSEKWRSAQALRQHFATPHMTTFRTGLRTLRGVRVAATSYEIATATELVQR